MDPAAPVGAAVTEERRPTSINTSRGSVDRMLDRDDSNCILALI